MYCVMIQALQPFMNKLFQMVVSLNQMT